MADRVGEALRLRALGLSVPKIAAALGVNPRTVNKWFAGRPESHGQNNGGPVAEGQPDFDAVAGAMLSMVERAIRQLDHERATPAKVASTMPALVKLMRSCPRPPPPPVKSEDDDFCTADIADLRSQLLEKVKQLHLEEQGDASSPLASILKRAKDRGLMHPEE